jgi:hypothetical protein
MRRLVVWSRRFRTVDLSQWILVGDPAYLSLGMTNVASLLRDLAQRLVTGCGLSWDDAVVTVTRGVSNGWYGCEPAHWGSGCEPVGLAEVMADWLGAFDPAEAILTRVPVNNRAARNNQ